MVGEQAAEIEPIPVLEAPRVPKFLVQTEAQLEALYQSLKVTSGPVAIDAERASGFKYSQRAYLVQLRAAEREIYLLDPVATPEALVSKPFIEIRKLLLDREWILHAATQDLPCLSEIGLKPGSIFDTELAARLVGLPRVGLGSLTEALLGIKLAKEHSAADWSTRPLPDSWLNYAALDVDVLHDLRNVIEELVAQQNKISWVKEEFTHLLSFTPKPPREEKWRSLSGLNKINDRQVLEIARNLWVAREELAKKMDIAPGRLLPDSAIIAASLAKPKSRSELASLKTFTGRASRSYLTTWWSAIEQGQKSTELPELRPKKTEGIPNHRIWASKFPEADLRLRLAKSSLSEIAKDKLLPIENLLTPDYLRQIAFNPPEVLTEESVDEKLKMLGARSWQRDLTKAAIASAFVQALEEKTTAPNRDLPEAGGH